MFSGLMCGAVRAASSSDWPMIWAALNSWRAMVKAATSLISPSDRTSPNVSPSSARIWVSVAGGQAGQDADPAGQVQPASSRGRAAIDATDLGGPLRDRPGPEDDPARQRSRNQQRVAATVCAYRVEHPQVAVRRFDEQLVWRSAATAFPVRQCLARAPSSTADSREGEGLTVQPQAISASRMDDGPRGATDAHGVGGAQPVRGRPRGTARIQMTPALRPASTGDSSSRSGARPFRWQFDDVQFAQLRQVFGRFSVARADWR